MGDGDMVNREHEPAYPVAHTGTKFGVTLREYYAGMAMQGWMANKDRPANYNPHDDMEYCLAVADELLAAMDANP